jgi:tRNA(Ile2) C34 agmatinyltransferase TiaS
VDDTDTKSGGATFALALGLLQYIGKMNGVIPIGHNVVMLNPYHVRRTGGNACSFIEFAIEPGRFSQLPGIISRFMAEESLSPEWGVAIKRGFLIPDELREFGKDARSRDITVQEARDLAERCGVTLIGRAGIIGALAAIAFSGLSSEVMLTPLGEDEA